MRSFSAPIIVSAALFGITGLALAGDTPDTLVTNEDGAFLPAAATSWMEVGGAVSFSLEKGVDPESVATVLTERLAAATVVVEGGKVKVSGIPLDNLLAQLSTLSLSGEGDDPLADLSQLGDAVASAGPEGGGSIRATNPNAMALASMMESHDPKEFFLAEIVRVSRGDFPTVLVRLKVRTTPTAGPLSTKLRRGRILEGPVILARKEGAIDLSEAKTQGNIGAYFLQRGDRINVHVRVGEKGRLELDYVERRSGGTCSSASEESGSS